MGDYCGSQSQKFNHSLYILLHRLCQNDLAGLIKLPGCLLLGDNRTRQPVQRLQSCLRCLFSCARVPFYYERFQLHFIFFVYLSCSIILAFCALMCFARVFLGFLSVCTLLFFLVFRGVRIFAPSFHLLFTVSLISCVNLHLLDPQIHVQRSLLLELYSRNH